MPSLTLVVMAAGVGSRYGGLKQIDSFGPSGEVVMEYSVYDALRAGYDRVVFIIRKDFETQFREKLGRKIERAVDTDYVFQSIDRLPPSFTLPEGRTKPWGTAHALLACRDAVATAFTAINADDFYGPSTYEIMARYLREPGDGEFDYAMVGYSLVNTLSEHGHVARGVCRPGPDGYLIDIRELHKIRRFPDAVKFSENGADWVPLAEDSLVSMNFWGFRPSLFDELERRFPEFLRAHADTLAKAEFLIPEAVGELVREGRARVRVLPTPERWFGVTYPEDRPVVEAAILDRVRRGIYPADLWAKT